MITGRDCSVARGEPKQRDENRGEAAQVSARCDGPSRDTLIGDFGDFGKRARAYATQLYPRQCA
jgi:hypothetical protein